MGTAAALIAPEAEDLPLQAPSASPKVAGGSDGPGGARQQRAPKRRRSGSGDRSDSGREAPGTDAPHSSDHQQQQDAEAHHQQPGKREHGHHGHLRTHTADRADAAAGPETAAGGRERGDEPPGSSTKPRHKQPQLSFADEIEEDSNQAAEGDGGGGGGGGGLRSATADRFRQEAAAASRAARHAHSFHPHRRRSEEGASSGGGGGGGGGGQGAARRGLAIVDASDSSGSEGAFGTTVHHGRGGGGCGGQTLGRIHFGVAAARGLRPYMEDRSVVVASMGLLADAPGGGERAGPPLPPDGVPRSYAAVFDGHNGAGAAELAAARLHLLLAAHPALRIHTGELGPPAVAKAEEAAIGDALRSAFGRVDEATLAVARREGVRDGATALVVLRLGQVLYAAHAGDSRAVLCRDGLAVRLTEDHKPHLPRERARIEGAGGRVDFQRCWRVVVEPRDGRPGSGLAVSRSLGDLDFKEPHKFVECEPDVLRMPLRPLQPSGAGDSFIVLGSDGLWDVLSDDDAIDCAKRALHSFKQRDPSGGSRDAQAQAAAEALLDESLRRGTADNVTVVCMLLNWGPGSAL